MSRPCRAIRPDRRRDVLVEHLLHRDIGRAATRWIDASDPIQEVRDEVGDLDTWVGLGADEVDGVDDVGGDEPVAERAAGALHAVEQFERERFVFVSLIGDEKRALAKRIRLLADEGLDLLHEELHGEQVRARVVHRAEGESRFVDRGVCDDSVVRADECKRGAIDLDSARWRHAAPWPVAAEQFRAVKFDEAPVGTLDAVDQVDHGVPECQCSILGHHYGDEIVHRLIGIVEASTGVPRLVQVAQPHERRSYRGPSVGRGFFTSQVPGVDRLARASAVTGNVGGSRPPLARRGRADWGDG